MKTMTRLHCVYILLYCTSLGLISSCGKGSVTDGNSPVKPTNPNATVTVPRITFTTTNLADDTQAPYVASHDTIVAGGFVTGDGGATVTARGICWSLAQNPTIADKKTSNGSGTGTFSGFASGLKVNTTYYLRAYATNSAGTGYSYQISLTTAYVIGEHFGGGTIFYIDSTSLHGLVVAQYARSASVWGSGYAGATSFFDGAANTDKIIQKFGANAQNAAALCRACRDGGYTDWFLPALYQLELTRAAPVGDIDWSSTESDSGSAYVLSSPYQDNYPEAKGYMHPARPVRAF